MGTAAPDQELGRIERAVAAVAAGERRALGVFGEVGFGRSALLGAAAAAAEASGFQVLSGRAAEHERELPFRLVRDALARRIEEVGPAEVAGPAERYRYHQAVAALLEQLGRERPFALLLDDLDRADEASIELVAHLLRRMPRVPHLLLFALRPVDPASPLIAAARSAPGWAELRPAPLAAETGDEQLARVREELAELPPAAAALLDGAAVAGDPFDPDVAVAAAGVGSPEQLDALVASGLVHPEPSGRDFRFRQPLLRRVAYEAIPADRRIAAHERAAIALAARGAEPAERIYHVEQYARPGDEEAISILTDGADGALDAAPATAARWYAAALELLPPGEDARRARLLTPLAQALRSTGRLEESRAALERAIALLPDGALAERLGLRRVSALTALWLGAFEAAEREIDRALAEAPAAERPRLLLYRGSIPFFRGQFAAIAPWVERAADEFGDGGDDATAVHLLAQQGQVQLFLGRPGGNLIERSLRRFRDLGDDAIAAYPYAAWSLGSNLNRVERYAEAAEVLGRGMKILRSSGQDQLLVHLGFLASRASLGILELDQALTLVEEVEETARLESLGDQLGLALAMRGQILEARGQHREAVRAAEESDRLYAGAEQDLGARTTRPFNAIIRFGEDPERLLGEVAAAAGTTIAQIDTVSTSGLLPPLVRAAVAAGRLEDAIRWIERTEAFAARAELPVSAARAVRGQVEVLLARDEVVAAAALAAEEAEVAAGASARQEELELRLLHGRALLDAGRRDEAIAVLQDLAEIAAAASAGALSDAAMRELRRAGAWEL